MLIKNILRKPYYFYLFINHNIQIFVKELVYSFLSRKVSIAELLNDDRIFTELSLKLHKRGIKWPLESGYKPHIVYASFPSEWERINIPHELRKIGTLSTYFTSDRGIDVSDRKEARKKIDLDFLLWVEQLHELTPVDVIVTYFSGAEISAKTIEKIKSKGIPIFTFHLDDRLHFFGKIIGGVWSGPYSVSKAYDLNLTNSSDSLKQYYFHKALALFWPEGANPEFFKPLSVPKEIDVLFIGANYGKRQALINYLKDNNVMVEAFGHRWPNGSVSSKEIVELVAKSKIALGFGYVGFSNYQCLKGRDFEFPCCGTVYLTSYNSELEYCYTIGKELETYSSREECLKKIRGLLKDNARLIEISQASREAVIQNHTWEKRFRKIFYYDVNKIADV